MRILHVVPTYLPATRYGGPIHSVHGLCKALAAAGHRVEVYTTSVDGEGDSDVPLGEPVELDGVRVWYFRTRLSRRLYRSPELGAALQRRVDRFDVAHLHSVFLWPTSRAARLAQAAGVPHIVSPRGMLVRELIEARSRVAKVAWLAAIESSTLASARAVHFTSEHERQDAGALPLPLPAPFVVPNGIDLPAPETRSTLAAATATPRHVLYLGRMSWIKNLEAAIGALVGTDMRLSLCGPDDEGLTPRLEALAARLGVGERVSFPGPVHGADKWARLAAAELLVLPSHNESFGNAVPEAMACGCPVVVTHGVGAGDIVRAAGAGLVCAPTPDGLREAMLRLWSDDAERARAGAAGLRYARDELGWPRIAARMAEHYSRLLAPRPGRAGGQGGRTGQSTQGGRTGQSTQSGRTGQSTQGGRIDRHRAGT